MQKNFISKFCLVFFSCISFHNSSLPANSLDKACAIAGTVSTVAMVYGLVNAYNVLNTKYKKTVSDDITISNSDMRRRIKAQILTQSVFTLIMAMTSLKLYLNAQH